MSGILPKDIRPAFPVHVPKDAVRSKLLELLGLDEIPEEVDFAEGTTCEEEGIRVTQLTYANSLGETVPGDSHDAAQYVESKTARCCLHTRHGRLRPKDRPSNGFI